MKYEFNVDSDSTVFTQKDGIKEKRSILSEKGKAYLKEFKFKKIKESNNKNKKRTINRKRPIAFREYVKMKESNKKIKSKLSEESIYLMTVGDVVDGMSNMFNFVITRKPNVNFYSELLSNAIISAVENNIEPEKQKIFMKRFIKFMVSFYKTL